MSPLPSEDPGRRPRPSEDHGTCPLQPEAAAVVTGAGPEDDEAPVMFVRPMVGAAVPVYVGGVGGGA